MMLTLKSKMICSFWVVLATSHKKVGDSLLCKRFVCFEIACLYALEKYMSVFFKQFHHEYPPMEKKQFKALVAFPLLKLVRQ